MTDLATLQKAAAKGGRRLKRLVKDVKTKGGKIKHFSDLSKMRKTFGGGRPKGSTKKKV